VGARNVDPLQAAVVTAFAREVGSERVPGSACGVLPAERFLAAQEAGTPG
jgi:hypothetical protein